MGQFRSCSHERPIRGNMSKLTVICGDSGQELPKLAEASIEMCLTSPPYDNLRSYAGHSWDFETIAKELYRVLVPGGILC